MNPDEHRQYAAELVLAHAQDVEYLSVFEMAWEYLEEGQLDDGEVSDEDGRAVHDLIRTAVVTVTFPGCDLEWSNVDEEE